MACTRLGKSSLGTLHLTTHHLIFRDNDTKRELWICYPIISHVERRYSNNASSYAQPDYALSSLSNGHHAAKSEISSNPYANTPSSSPSQRTPTAVTHHTASTIRIRCKDFTFVAFSFSSDAAAKDTFESLLRLTCIPDVSRLYAFIYKPLSHESAFNGWTIYDPIAEFQRMGALPSAGSSAESRWRVSTINSDYKFSPTYPATIVVPACISDTVLSYGAKFRSKLRIPALTYYHAFNGCTITRCSQPMVGIKQSRSAQDEKVVAAIFASNQPVAHHSHGHGHGHGHGHSHNKEIIATIITPGNKQDNLIVDARPTANAMAQTALGAGSENMENYKTARKIYLGIDNIHVMRDSLNRVVDALKDGDISARPPSKEALYKSHWLRYISTIMDGAVAVVQQVHVAFSHVLIHCSDGWDRTAQLAGLAEIMLDPYYRTLDGFMVLVEKEWLSFGHQFAERSNHLNSERNFVEVQVSSPANLGGPRGAEFGNGAVNGGMNNSGTNSNNGNSYAQAHQVLRDVGSKFVKSTISTLGSGAGGGGNNNMKYTSPVFHQFLDAVYQLVTQFPDRFEFGERFLRRLLYHTYSCQYGTFLFNNEAQRKKANAAQATRSVWDYFLARRKEFATNPGYDREREFSYDADKTVLVPNTRALKYWAELFGRTSEEMNSRPREKEPQQIAAGGQQDGQALAGNSSSSPAVAAASAIASIFNNIAGPSSPAPVASSPSPSPSLPEPLSSNGSSRDLSLLASSPLSASPRPYSALQTPISAPSPAPKPADEQPLEKSPIDSNVDPLGNTPLSASSDTSASASTAVPAAIGSRRLTAHRINRIASSSRSASEAGFPSASLSRPETPAARSISPESPAAPTPSSTKPVKEAATTPKPKSPVSSPAVIAQAQSPPAANGTTAANQEEKEQLDPKAYVQQFGAMAMMDYDDTSSSGGKSSGSKLRGKLGLF